MPKTVADKKFSDVNKMIDEDKIFVEPHKGKDGKIAWLGSGGPSFATRTMTIFQRHDTILSMLKYHAQIFHSGIICQPFFVAYDENLYENEE